MVDGEAGDFGPHRPEDRDEMMGLLGRLHAAAAPDVERAGLGLPGRDELRAALDELGRPWNAGPYGEPVRGLLAGRRQRIERMLGEYDRLAALLPGEDEWVVTHGEPHPGNVIRTADGLRLIDWDTVRLAPRERDLWLVAAGGGDPDALAFYRLRWTLADVAGFVADLRAPHGAGGDAGAAWTFLSGYLASPEA
jgi:spectinomycin phosphotransferase